MNANVNIESQSAVRISVNMDNESQFNVAPECDDYVVLIRNTKHCDRGELFGPITFRVIA